MAPASCSGAEPCAWCRYLCPAGLWPCVECRELAQPLPCRGILGSPLAGCEESRVPVANAVPCAAAEPRPPNYEGVAMKPARSAEKRLLVATPFAAQSPPAERAPVITSGVM